MTSIEKLAKLFTERNNAYHISVTTGVVISTSPLKVKWGDSIILDGSSLIVSNILKNGFTVEYTDNNGSTTSTKSITIKNPLIIGDEVIMLPDNDFKNWYLIDKVGS